MAKGKKKKKAKAIDPDAQKTITILVPDAIGNLEKKTLHAIGRLTAAAASTFDVTDVAIIKTSQLSGKCHGPRVWHKSIPDV
ncbi:MAG TPA: hypothetical protein VEI07_09620 [Planctomycetaceae bacterium]|nr:hypothetical protein [Planctomycetaceae bacterium]